MKTRSEKDNYEPLENDCVMNLRSRKITGTIKSKHKMRKTKNIIEKKPQINFNSHSFKQLLTTVDPLIAFNCINNRLCKPFDPKTGLVRSEYCCWRVKFNDCYKLFVFPTKFFNENYRNVNNLLLKIGHYFEDHYIAITGGRNYDQFIDCVEVFPYRIYEQKYATGCELTREEKLRLVSIYYCEY